MLHKREKIKHIVIYRYFVIFCCHRVIRGGSSLQKITLRGISHNYLLTDVSFPGSLGLARKRMPCHSGISNICPCTKIIQMVERKAYLSSLLKLPQGQLGRRNCGKVYAPPPLRNLKLSLFENKYFECEQWFCVWGWQKGTILPHYIKDIWSSQSTMCTALVEKGLTVLCIHRITTLCSKTNCKSIPNAKCKVNRTYFLFRCGLRSEGRGVDSENLDLDYPESQTAL